MSMTRETKEDVVWMLRVGKKNNAIQFLKDTQDLSFEHAAKIVDDIEQQLNTGSFSEKKSAAGKPQRRSMQSTTEIRSPLPVIFGILAVLLFFTTGYLFWRNHQLTSAYRATRGVVTELVPSNELYAARVTYTWEGTNYSYVSHSSSDPAVYSIGEQVTMFINPMQPSDAFIDSITDRWLGTMITGILTFGFTFFTVLFAFKQRRF